MSIDGWMINAGAMISVGIGTYAVLRSRVLRLEQDFKSHNEDDTLYHKDTERRMSAQFKRIDEISNTSIVLSTKVNSMLSAESADEKFVSKQELSLHLRNIENNIGHMNKSSDQIMAKLGKLTEDFSAYILKANKNG